MKNIFMEKHILPISLLFIKGDLVVPEFLLELPAAAEVGTTMQGMGETLWMQNFCHLVPTRAGNHWTPRS